MEALFVIFRADGERHDFHITPGKRYVIGRNESSDIRVPLPSVSREHAAVFFDEEDDELIIEDLGSSNGTYVNHDRIGGREELTPGDVVRIGDVPFQVVIDGHPADLEPIVMGKTKPARADTHTTIGRAGDATRAAPVDDDNDNDSEPDLGAGGPGGGTGDNGDSKIDSFFGFDLDDSDI